jgi:hypothetical protein
MKHNYLDVAEAMLRKKHSLPKDFKFTTYTATDNGTILSGHSVNGAFSSHFTVTDEEVKSHPDYREWK